MCSFLRQVLMLEKPVDVGLNPNLAPPLVAVEGADGTWNDDGAASSASRSIRRGTALSAVIAAGVTSAGSWLSMAAIGTFCITNATASACREQVRKSDLSETSVKPCSCDVFTRCSRRKKTLLADTDMFCFCMNARSDARPKQCHMRHRSAAS